MLVYVNKGRWGPARAPCKWQCHQTRSIMSVASWAASWAKLHHYVTDKNSPITEAVTAHWHGLAPGMLCSD